MLKNNKVLLASSNQGKIREFKKIFKGFDFISQEDLGIDDAVEDGISFFENALKLLTASKQSYQFRVQLRYTKIPSGLSTGSSWTYEE